MCPCPFDLPESPVPGQCLQVYAPQLDRGRIAACIGGDTGVALMHRNAQLTEALNPPHQYVPWIVINGVRRGQGGEPGRRAGPGHGRDSPDSPILTPPLQKHTDELQEQAEASLVGLICRLYQVGQGPAGAGGGRGTRPRPHRGSTGCSPPGGEARSLWGVADPEGPEGPGPLHALRDGAGAPSGRRIKKGGFSGKTQRLRSGVSGGAGGAGGAESGSAALGPASRPLLPPSVSWRPPVPL